MAGLPYVTAPGNVERALAGIKTAATPTTVSQDFVKTILNIPGGSGNQMTAYLRKIGFVNADGSPSPLYKQFRNAEHSGAAAAAALKIGYAALYVRNEYMHQLSDDKLRGLIIEETGSAEDAAPVNMILSCIKTLKKHAKWSAATETTLVAEPDPLQSIKLIAKDVDKATGPASSASNGAGSSGQSKDAAVGLNLAYTINLNLPATSDIAVFNAIFKSLKENLLKGANG
jgi:hypothetical protein